MAKQGKYDYGEWRLKEQDWMDGYRVMIGLVWGLEGAIVWWLVGGEIRCAKAMFARIWRFGESSGWI